MQSFLAAAALSAPPTGVAEVERATGIPRATLRIWERRYGFPNPERDARGERFYDEAQIAKLRLIAVLVARGHRPSRIIDLPTEALRQLAAEPGTALRVGGDHVLIRLLQGLDAGALTGWLLQQLAANGLERFVVEIVPAASAQVGQAWACGQLQIHEEHLYTECLQQVLRTAMAALPPAGAASRPRVLLATLPREQHGLGLLCAQALLALDGCACLPLGLNLPPAEVAAAARTWHPQAVALSFSQAYSTREFWPSLLEMRGQLAPEVMLWLGGRCAALTRPEVTALPGVQHLPELADLKPAVAALRAAAG